MDVRLVTAGKIEAYPPDEVAALLKRGEGTVWVDVETCDEEAVRVLSEVFNFHPLAIRDCVQRNRVAKVHAYPTYVFVVLHAPEMGRAGHVHYVELDQFIGPGYLVTVHGPMNPAVDRAIAHRETSSVLARIEAGRLSPASSFELSYAIVSALSRHLESFVERLTEQVWSLEQQVTAGHFGNPEKFLEEMFQARHGLITARTMATVSREAYGRMSALRRAVPDDARPLVNDIVDQFNRMYGIADGQKEYLQGVIEYYRTRSDTKMTIAAERLAVIAALTLPITALSSVYGMNLIVNTTTQPEHLIVVLIVMLAMSAALLVWAKRQGWW
jgi:Mg2+ and Co2+ transporter CorA